MDALNEALTRYKVPEIFNTDQGSQFTSREFTQALKEVGTLISPWMGGARRAGGRAA